MPEQSRDDSEMIDMQRLSSNCCNLTLSWRVVSQNKASLRGSCTSRYDRDREIFQVWVVLPLPTLPIGTSVFHHIHAHTGSSLTLCDKSKDPRNLLFVSREAEGVR